MKEKTDAPITFQTIIEEINWLIAAGELPSVNDVQETLDEDTVQRIRDKALAKIRTHASTVTKKPGTTLVSVATSTLEAKLIQRQRDSVSTDVLTILQESKPDMRASQPVYGEGPSSFTLPMSAMFLPPETFQQILEEALRPLYQAITCLQGKSEEKPEKAETDQVIRAYSEKSVTKKRWSPPWLGVYLETNVAVIVQFLRNPPRALLLHVLAELAIPILRDKYPELLADKQQSMARERSRRTVDKMLRIGALSENTKYPDRLTINPAFTHLECNLGMIEDDIWTAVRSYLADPEAAWELGKSESWSEAWNDIREVAEERKRHELCVESARRAYRHARKEDLGVALFQLARSLHEKPNPEWSEAILYYTQALEHLPEDQKPIDRGITLRYLAFCLHNRPDPSWEEAVDIYRQALRLLGEYDNTPDRPIALFWLAFCLCHVSESSWEAAADLYQQAANLLNDPQAREFRAIVLLNRAECLQRQRNTDWAGAATCYRDGLGLLRPDQRKDWVIAQLEFARCLRKERAWDEAARAYREALELLTRPEQRTIRADVLFEFARFLHRELDQPQWQEALERYRESLGLWTELDRQKNRALTMRQLAFCLRQKPEPEFKEAADLCRSALTLLSRQEDQAAYAETLFELGVSLRSLKGWNRAITALRDCLDLLDPRDEPTNRAITLWELGECLFMQQKPVWAEAAACFREAAGLFDVAGNQSKRAHVLVLWALCLHAQRPVNQEKITDCGQQMRSLNCKRERRELALTLLRLAADLREQGKPDWSEAALFCYRQAASLLDSPENQGELAAALLQLAHCLRALDPDSEEAQACQQQADTIIGSQAQQVVRKRPTPMPRRPNRGENR